MRTRDGVFSDAAGDVDIVSSLYANAIGNGNALGRRRGFDRRLRTALKWTAESLQALRGIGWSVQPPANYRSLRSDCY